MIYRRAFDSNWIAPLGPHVDGFENEMAKYLGVNHAAALSSGSDALLAKNVARSGKWVFYPLMEIKLLPRLVAEC